MTEHEFEQRIEAAADKFDKSVSKKWNNSRFFRIGIKSVSLISEAAIIIGSVHLAKQGHKTAAAWCFGLGAVGVIADIIIAITFRRNSSHGTKTIY